MWSVDAKETHTVWLLSLQIWREEMQQVYLGKAIIPEEVDK